MAPNIPAWAKLFILYLYDNNHLDSDYSISKKDAQNIYNRDFQEEFKVHAKFSCLFMYFIRFLKKNNGDKTIMTFHEQKLKNLLQKRDSLETKVEKDDSRKLRKKTVVSQSFSFHRNVRKAEDFCSEKECKLCDIKFANSDSFAEHLREKTHIFFEKYLKAFQQHKKIKKEHPLQFSVDNSQSVENIIIRKGVSKSLTLNVKNVSKKTYKIVAIEADDADEEIKFHPVLPVHVTPSMAMQFSLTVCCDNKTVLYYPILITLTEEESDKRTVDVPLELVFHVHDENLDDLHPREMFVRRSKPAVSDLYEEIDLGEPPKFSTSYDLRVPLKKYPLTADFRLIVNKGLKSFIGITDSQKSLLNRINSLLDVEDKKHCLNASNYTEMLQTFLYLEEHQLLMDIRDYDRENQELKIIPKSCLLQLEVPGLAENRPSVVLGDIVSVKENKTSKTIYQGFVHQVNESSVSLRFSQRYLTNVYASKKRFYVSFSFNRYPLKVAHQAVDLIKQHNIASVFFSKTTASDPALTHNPIKWFDENLENNDKQQQAVQAILQRTSMPRPYLVFGPPGTGKTITIVECVKQIHKQTKFNVLICAPSNSAANEIAKRLITGRGTVPKEDLFRYIALSFPQSLIPANLKEYTNYKYGSCFHPSVEELMKYRIVITTLCTAAKLVNAGCAKGHYDYIFIDESGQATETDTLIPIAGNLTGQIVLAGDPKQLGPIIHSTLAKDYGFDVSMLERLMETVDLYKKDSENHYNPNYLTKLVRNYRSHPAIIKKPNELFYENELECVADKLINVALNWRELPNLDFPVIFHSVVGVDQREQNSPSFFNIQEIGVVVQYLNKLIGSTMQDVKITEEHIGIISPYKKQVEKIVKICNKENYSKKLLIGTVEQVQGQERLIIILSTVRSRASFLKIDNKHHLGFLNNPKRFNVAITRAKALLIVIGNPNLLQCDEHWKSFIAFCKDNNAVTGESFEMQE